MIMIIDLEDKETQERIQSWINEDKIVTTFRKYADDYFKLAIQLHSPEDIYRSIDNITPYVSSKDTLFTDEDIQNMREYLKCLCVKASQIHKEWPTITIESLQNPDIAKEFAKGNPNAVNDVSKTREELDQALVDRANLMNYFRGKGRDASK